MTYFAYYRLPYADTYTVIESKSEPLILSSLDDIGGSAGFVIAPFRQSAVCPIVLIKPDRVEERSIKSQDVIKELKSKESENTPPTTNYESAFTTFHNAVYNNQFHKLVLARSKTCQQLTPFGSIGVGCEVGSLFLRACQLYPRLTIIFFSTPQTGTWLIASPEILVEGKAGNYHTVALAGTMPYTDGYPEWSDKNKQEQHIVEQYITDTITPLSRDVLKDGPITMRAGNLVHLRTDFRFHLKPETTLGILISHLHPTPAICGLPKQQAQEFIIANEHLDRHYYSGFSGPVNIHGETHLYVSLRCAELHDDNAVLYAGGGIMPDSQCQTEWQETESKMKTIANVLQ